MLFALGMGFSGLKQSWQDRSAFGQQLVPNVLVNPFIGVIQKLDQGVDFIGLHVACRLLGAVGTKTTRHFHVLQEGRCAVFTSLVLMAWEVVEPLLVIFPLQMPILPTSSPQVTDRMRLSYALWFTMAFLLTIWSVYALNDMLGLGWRKHGVHPRQWEGLTGVLTYPFLHGDLGHLWNNTMSFFTLNGFLFYFYRSIALRVWLWLFFASGLLLWGLAVDGNHIGASGIIYGLAAFLFTSGIIRDNRLLLRVSLAVAFLYGGIVWWMLPIDDHVSWEGHLSGAIVGVALAVAFRRQGPLDPTYAFEKEDPEAPLPEWWMAAHPDHPSTLAQRAQENAQKEAKSPTFTSSTDVPRFDPPSTT